MRFIVDNRSFRWRPAGPVGVIVQFSLSIIPSVDSLPDGWQRSKDRRNYAGNRSRSRAVIRPPRVHDSLTPDVRRPAMIPSANRVTTNDVPPNETSGTVSPVSGRTLNVPPEINST